MPRNTLFRMMKLLKKDELAEVSSFLHCELHCTRPEFRACFQALKAVYPKMDEQKLTDEMLFAKVFKGEDYDDMKLRRMKSEMCRLLEDYLAIKELKSTSPQRSILLTNALEGRDNYLLYKETIEKRLRKLESSQARGKTYFQEAAHLYRSLYFHPETERLASDIDYLQHYIEAIENYFIIANLENESEIIVRKRNINTNERMFFAQSVYAAATKKTEGLPVVQSFFELLQALKDEASSFDEVKQLVFSMLPQMDFQERQMAMKLLTSKAHAITKAGSPEQIKLTFELYKKSVEEGLSISINGVMESNHFINIVITGARTGEFDWVQRFIEKHKKHLPIAERGPVENLCLGSIYYQQGLKYGGNHYYEKALEYLDKIPQRSPEIYNLRTRSLLIRIHFELNQKNKDFESVEKQLRNFESYLNSNRRLSKPKKEEYRNFLSNTRHLCKLWPNPDTTKASVDKYLVERIGSDRASMQEWLIQKAEELKKSLRPSKG